MEGMSLKEICVLQKAYVVMSGSNLLMDDWSRGLVIKLLKITHSQWLYRNVQVHDTIMGVDATRRTEEL